MVTQVARVVQNGGDVVKSILELDPSDGTELYLLFTPGTTNGPAISRTGRGSPTMINRAQPFGEPTANPDLQRYQSLVVDEGVRQKNLERLDAQIAAMDPCPERVCLEKYVDDLRQQPTYEDKFRALYKRGYSVLAMQGYGDLTMNLWNVGYIRYLRGKRHPDILHLFEEPLDRRSYTCLVKWLPDDEGRVRYSIEELRFNRFAFNVDHNGADVVINEKGQPIADKIEFAIYGQQLVRDGHVASLEGLVHEFSDIRHVFQLPNINPKGELSDDDGGYPRTYFGRKQHADVWFGEEQLLESRNLRTAALRGSIELALERPGVDADVLSKALKIARYDKVDEHASLITREQLDKNLAAGEPYRSEWKFVHDDPSRIEILLKECIYPCTMVGTTADNRLLLFAWGTIYAKRPGWTLRESAGQIVGLGAQNAILCDEGSDVFQYYRGDKTRRLQCVIRPPRSQARAVLVAARKCPKAAGKGQAGSAAC